MRGFQYSSSVLVLHYLQAVLFIKIWTIVTNILYNTLCLKSIKVPGTTHYWKAWLHTFYCYYHSSSFYLTLIWHEILLIKRIKINQEKKIRYIYKIIKRLNKKDKIIYKFIKSRKKIKFKSNSILLCKLIFKTTSLAT